MNPQLERLFIQWAKAKKIRKPDSEIGLRLLQQEFMNELQARAAQVATVAAQAQEVMGAAGDVTHSTDPVSRLDPHMHIMRDSGGLTEVMDVETEDSDFTELIRNKQRAHEEAGGDELAALIIHRDHVGKQLPPDSPAPPSATKGLLGSSALVSNAQGSVGLPQVFGGVSTNPAVGSSNQVVLAEVARWNADNDFETRPVTITFQNITATPISSKAAITPLGLRPFGLVQFGTSSASSPLYVDIGRGCQFTVGASAVSVAVGVDPVASTIINQMQLAGMISFNPVVRTTPIYRTVYLDDLEGATVTVNVPPFANRVWFFRTAPASVAASLVFTDSTNNAVYEVDVAAGSNMTVPIPLTSEVAFIQVAKTAGASNYARLVFELGL